MAVFLGRMKNGELWRYFGKGIQLQNAGELESLYDSSGPRTYYMPLE